MSILRRLKIFSIISDATSVFQFLRIILDKICREITILINRFIKCNRLVPDVMLLVLQINIFQSHAKAI